MSERKGVVTFKGNPLTLAGPELKVGDKLPDATLTTTDLTPKHLSAYQGKVLVVSTVPSLDTPVCDKQTKRFSEEADKLGEDVKIITISMDLPFAQKRWCGATGIENMVTLSDYKERQFAQASGLLLKELGLLARAVVVADREGTVRYIQIVPEVGSEPDYAAVLKTLKDIQE